MPTFTNTSSVIAGTGVIHVEWSGLPIKLLDASYVNIAIQLAGVTVPGYYFPSVKAHDMSYNVIDLSGNTYDVVLSVYDASNNFVVSATKNVPTVRDQHFNLTGHPNKDGSMSVSWVDISHNRIAGAANTLSVNGIDLPWANVLDVSATVGVPNGRSAKLTYANLGSSEGTKLIKLTKMNNGFQATSNLKGISDLKGDISVPVVVEDPKTGVINTISWTHQYADASSQYVLTIQDASSNNAVQFRVGAAGPSVSSYTTLADANVIKDIYGLQLSTSTTINKLSNYRYKITAIDNKTGFDTDASNSKVQALAKNASFAPSLVVNRYTGALTATIVDISSAVIKHTYTAYLFMDASATKLMTDVSNATFTGGVPANSHKFATMVKSGFNFKCVFASADIPDNKFYSVIVVTDNNYFALHKYSTPETKVKRITSVSAFASDISRYAQYRELKIKWTDVREAGDQTPITYTVSLREADNNSVVVDSKSLLTTYADSHALTFFLVKNKSYNVKIAVQQGTVVWYEEIIVNLSAYSALPNLPAQPTPTPVKVNLHVSLDMSTKVMIFGEAPEVSGNVVVSKQGLAADDLWKLDSSEGLIQFWESATKPGEFLAEFTIDKDGNESAGSSAKNHALRLLNDLHLALTSGGLDASAAMPFARYNTSSVYNQFTSVGTMALAYAAEKIFGHPSALVAITNDKSIVDTMNNSAAAAHSTADFGGVIAAATQNAVDPITRIDMPGRGQLALRLVQTLLFGGGALASDARALLIAMSVIGQDADRARNQDNNEPSPSVKQLLRFYPGDQVFFTVNFKGFTANNNSAMNGVVNSPSSANSLTNSVINGRLSTESYTFVFNLH